MRLPIILAIAALLHPVSASAQATQIADSASSANAADSQSRSRFEASLNGGPILPSRIPGTREILNGWSSRFGLRSGIGLWELENYFGIGSGSRYQSHMISYRFDLQADPSFFPFYFSLGGQFDFIESETRGARRGFGWHYGAGLIIPIAGPIHLRSDFKHRFSPGQSLVVTAGLGLSI